MSLRRFIPVFLCLTVLAASSAALADEGVLKIAYANPAKIFTDLKETQELIAKMQTDQKQLANTQQDKQTQLKAMQDALQMLKPEAPQYQDKSRELLKASIEYDVWLQLTTKDLQRQQKQQIKTLFDKIQDAIAKIAQERNINLVLADQRPDLPDNLENIDLNTLRALISQRTILYSDGKDDISSDVTTRLDSDYAAEHK